MKKNKNKIILFSIFGVLGVVLAGIIIAGVLTNNDGGGGDSTTTTTLPSQYCNPKNDEVACRLCRFADDIYYFYKDGYMKCCTVLSNGQMWCEDNLPAPSTGDLCYVYCD